jgi:hypothetical protein
VSTEIADVPGTEPWIVLYFTPEEKAKCMAVCETGWYTFKALGFEKSKTPGEIVVTVVGSKA